MNSKTDAEYRLRLAKGFQNEAEQDFQLQRWRSCVDNAQLAVENAGKAIIAIFEPVERTHNPAIKLRQLIDKNLIDTSLLDDLNTALSAFDELGFEEYFLTDYGDEEAYRDPWSLFSEEDAKKAMEITRQCLTVAEKFYQFHYPQSPPAGENKENLESASR
ncbi:MAG: HEPN domain-containing protein [candidate division KSB1 bacterium]|nr:HEPN domain-containing protein [candidate division KSB1 bacterium]MDZ7303225.1 HEPN domain-containing protein [candidate division KSB1 bacterium]MDZ7312163.1 HEPN domain-containing protein [candidate division KSB1 bacterium]